MRLKERMEGGVTVFALTGEIDFHFAPVLRAMLQAKIKKKCPALILDFSDVQFIDSRGIAVILECLRDVGLYGGRIGLAALHPDVKPIVDTVRLETVMPIFVSVGEGVESMSAHLIPIHDTPG
jgi:anti-anti-sigma factor